MFAGKHQLDDVKLIDCWVYMRRVFLKLIVREYYQAINESRISD